MRRALLPMLALAAGLAGCGGSSDNKSSSQAPPAPAKKAKPAATGSASTLKLSADPSKLKFDQSALSGKAGKVTVVMANPSSIPHAVAVEGNGVDKDGSTVTKGGTSKVTVTLKPGTYEFYCPVDGHKAAGMEGKLTIK